MSPERGKREEHQHCSKTNTKTAFWYHTLTSISLFSKEHVAIMDVIQLPPRLHKWKARHLWSPSLTGMELENRQNERFCIHEELYTGQTCLWALTSSWSSCKECEYDSSPTGPQSPGQGENITFNREDKIEWGKIIKTSLCTHQPATLFTERSLHLQPHSHTYMHMYMPKHQVNFVLLHTKAGMCSTMNYTSNLLTPKPQGS